MSWFSDFFGGEEEQKIEKTSTLSPAQEQMMSQLGQYLQSMIGQGATPWTGSFTAPMSEAEKTGMGQTCIAVGDVPGPFTASPAPGIGPSASLGMPPQH